jgi:molybdate transport system permease protein
LINFSTIGTSFAFYKSMMIFMRSSERLLCSDSSEDSGCSQIPIDLGFKLIIHNLLFIVWLGGLFLLTGGCSVKSAYSGLEQEVLSTNESSVVITIAMASSLRGVGKAMAEEFSQLFPGYNLQITYGASGGLGNQIIHGAPWEVFLSADMATPLLVYRQRSAVKTPEVYAHGSMVLIYDRSHEELVQRVINTQSSVIAEENQSENSSWQMLDRDGLGQILTFYLNSSMLDQQEESDFITSNNGSSGRRQLILANPDTAPYGRAAMEVLTHMENLPWIHQHLVYGQTSAQAYGFITNSQGMGVINRSALVPYELSHPSLSTYSWIPIDPDLHSPIYHGALQLTNSPGARIFMDYLFSPRGQALLLAGGFTLPNGVTRSSSESLPGQVVQDSNQLQGFTGSDNHWLEPFRVSLGYSFWVSGILLILCLPLAWIFGRTQKGWLLPLEAGLSLGLVLPPTVLGFYLLVALSPNHFLGRFFRNILGVDLVFSFPGLVIGGCISGLPFMLLALKAGVRSIDESLLEAARTMGKGAINQFLHIILPLLIPSMVSGVLSTFAHSLGEFGVALMIGGSIPGKTKVVSIAIFESVESLNFEAAQNYAFILLITSYLGVLSLHMVQKKMKGNL